QTLPSERCRSRRATYFGRNCGWSSACASASICVCSSWKIGFTSRYGSIPGNGDGIAILLARAFLLGYLALNPCDKLRQRHDALIAFAAMAHGDGACRLLFVADDEHVRDLLKLGGADLGADLLGAVVAADAEAFALQLAFHFVGVIVELLADGDDAHL